MRTSAGRRWSQLRLQPWMPAVGLAIIAWIIVAPWGDYGLNDDWTYAHIAKQYALTGHIRLDLPTAATAAGPAVIAAPFLRLFGFSHVILRILSMLFSCFAIVAFDRLLVHVTERFSLRVMCLVLLVFNPIYFYASTSYMTEIHGWAPALVACALWFWDRRRADVRAEADGKERSAISWWVSILVGVIAGSTFWTRQWCVLVYPALLGATGLRLLLEKRWTTIVRTLPGLALGAPLYFLVIWSFFPWARATGNLRPEFVGQIPNITKFDRDVFIMQAGSALIYMSVFFFPLLALSSWRRESRRLLYPLALCLLFLALYARSQFEATSTSDESFSAWTHKTFPFVSNIIYNAGIGPVTIDDAFAHHGARPSWPREIWAGLEVLFVAATAAWSPVILNTARVLTTRRRTVGYEVSVFGLLLTFGCLVAALQVYKNEINDRYYLPLVFGTLLFVPATLDFVRGQAPDLVLREKIAVFALFLLPLAWFSIAGVHDEFRWQDARWKLVTSGLRHGATHATLQSGYEVNCWFRYEDLTDEEKQCKGGCTCRMGPGFCCLDDRWRVGMSLLPGYTQVEAIQPHYWLTSGPPMLLSKR